MTDNVPERYRTKDGSMIRELMNQSVHPGLGMSLAEAVVEAGGRTAEHRHADFDEIYYGLEGEGTLYVDGRPFAFGPDSCRLMPRGAAHYVEAVTRLRFLCACCPGYSHEGTVLLDERFSASGSRDRESA